MAVAEQGGREASVVNVASPPNVEERGKGPGAELLAEKEHYHEGAYPPGPAEPASTSDVDESPQGNPPTVGWERACDGQELKHVVYLHL